MFDILQRLSLAVENIHVKSIINSPGKYMLFTLLLGVIAAIFNMPIWIVIVIFVFAGVFLLIIIFMTIYFSIKAPDYLRSEEYNLKKQTIETLGDKDNYLPIDTSVIVDVVNNYQEYLLPENRRGSNE